MADPTGLGSAIAKMRSRSSRLADLTPALSQVQREITQEIGHAFQNQESPAGESWPPTKDGRPFDHAGDFQREIQVVVDGTGKIKITGPSYLKAHMRGGMLNGKPGHPPKRNPIPIELTATGPTLTPKVARSVQDAVISHVVGGQ